MFLRTIYERIQMNRIVNFKGNRAERHACASSNICRMPHPITVWEPAGSQKNIRETLEQRISNEFIGVCVSIVLTCFE